MNFGLSAQHELLLKNIFQKYLKSGLLIVYGSRAKGNFTNRSDIDIVIKNGNFNETKHLSIITEEINESNFPYLIDLQLYEQIKNPKLKKHIDTYGKKFLDLDNH